MKTSKFIAVLLTIFSFTISAQSIEKSNSQYKLKLFGVERNIALYAGTDFSYIKYDKKDAGLVTLKAGVNIDNYTVGLSFSGLYYDKKLNKLVNDGTYHVNSGFASIFIERNFDLTDDLKLNIGISSGNGMISYRYDKDYRKNKVWSEEIIDCTEFSVLEPSIEFSYKLYDNWWFGVKGSYLNTCDIQLIGTDKDVMKTFTTGITLKYIIL